MAPTPRQRLPAGKRVSPARVSCGGTAEVFPKQPRPPPPLLVTLEAADGPALPPPPPCPVLPAQLCPDLIVIRLTGRAFGECRFPGPHPKD